MFQECSDVQERHYDGDDEEDARTSSGAVDTGNEFEHGSATADADKCLRHSLLPLRDAAHRRHVFFRHTSVTVQRSGVLDTFCDRCAYTVSGIGYAAAMSFCLRHR